ncbi:MAG: dTDP-4-dehydrorhamnose 3,5-epimerase family protein [Thermodesulfobacteriota bacterium]
MIKGVEIKELKALTDERGFLMEMLRRDDPVFEKFGQVYVTCCKYGVAKAWHYHKEQTDHFVTVFGKALVVLYDMREDSPSKGEVQEFVLEAPPSKKTVLLKIPKQVAHGFTATEKEEARIINVPTLTYNYDTPDEYRFPWDSQEIPYKWPSFVTSGG